MPLLITTSKQKAKWAAVEDTSITIQLVKQTAKWAAIEDGDHNASITTHVEKQKAKLATKSKTNTGTTALEPSVH